MEIQPYYNRENNTLFLSRGHAPNLMHRIVWFEPDKMNFPMNFLINAISEEENELIDEYLKSKDEEHKEEIQKKFPYVDLERVITNGNGNTTGVSSTLSPILQSLKKNLDISERRKNFNRPISYRSYERSYEYWKDILPHVNLCPDAKMCWESVLRKLGAKKVYGMNNDYIPFYVVVTANFQNPDMLKKDYGL